MANSHLVARVKAGLDEVEIRLYDRAYLIRRESGNPGKPVRCGAFYDPDHKPLPLIEVAVRWWKSAEDVVLAVIHELAHHCDFGETVVDGGLELVLYASRTLREAVALRLLGIRLGFRDK